MHLKEACEVEIVRYYTTNSAKYDLYFESVKVTTKETRKYSTLHTKSDFLQQRQTKSWYGTKDDAAHLHQLHAV